MMRIIARRYIPLRFGASRSENLRLDRVGKHLHCVGLGHLAICAATNRHPLGLLYRSWTRIYVAGLCRKFGRSRPTAAAAAPAMSRLVHLEVVRHEQMAVAADIGDGHALEDTFQRKAHEISFGCSKAGPRYQFQ
jgi:hypothetical protein